MTRKAEWPFAVTGPGQDEKRFPVVGAAIAFAQMRTGQLGATFEVSEWEDVIARTVKREGVVVTLDGRRG